VSEYHKVGEKSEKSESPKIGDRHDVDWDGPSHIEVVKVTPTHVHVQRASKNSGRKDGIGNEYRLTHGEFHEWTGTMKKAEHPSSEWTLHDHQTNEDAEMKIYKKPSQIGNEKYRAVYTSKDGKKITTTEDHNTPKAAQMAGFDKHYSDIKKAEQNSINELSKSESKKGRLLGDGSDWRVKNHGQKDETWSHPVHGTVEKENGRFYSKHPKYANYGSDNHHSAPDARKHLERVTSDEAKSLKKDEHPAFTANKGKINEIANKSMHKAEKDAIHQFMKMTKSEPKIQHYKGHMIERTGDKQTLGSGFSTKTVDTPHRTEYSVMHTDKEGKLNLHPTTFSSIDHAKAHIDKLKKSECEALTKGEGGGGVRSFDHTKKQKGTGKHWTVAHTAPKTDTENKIHAHHFDTAHQAGKYAQHWEDTVGQHNNDRPEIYGPERDEDK